MSKKITSWKKLWNDLGTRRWIFLLLVGILLVVIAIPVEKDTDNNTSQSGGGAGTPQSSLLGSGNSSGRAGTGSSTNGSGGSDYDGSGTTNSWDVSSYEEELEKRLVQILSQIEGAGQVQVMVTVKRSSELILQSDTSWEESVVRETDSQGGVRDNAEVRQDSQTVLTGGSGTSQPYVVGEIMPQVEGVVVACQGGDRASVQAEISAAIQALFDLQPHKIKVCKMASP